MNKNRYDVMMAGLLAGTLALIIGIIAFFTYQGSVGWYEVQKELYRAAAQNGMHCTTTTNSVTCTPVGR